MAALHFLQRHSSRWIADSSSSVVASLASLPGVILAGGVGRAVDHQFGPGLGVQQPQQAGGGQLDLARIAEPDRQHVEAAGGYFQLPVELADIEIAEQARKVLMQAPKNGFFYVLDRVDGSLISTEPYVQVNWASHVDAESGRPVETSNARYEEGPFLIMPSPFGGHNWHPMAFDPKRGLVYMPTQNIPFAHVDDPDFEFLDTQWNTGTNFSVNATPSDPAALEQLVEGSLADADRRVRPDRGESHVLGHVVLQPLDPFPGRQLALGVLVVDTFLTAALAGVVVFLAIFELLARQGNRLARRQREVG